jgi:hypothetical protein
MNLLVNSKEDYNEQRLYQCSKDGMICGTIFKIGEINFDEFGYNGELFLTAKHCVEEYDEEMFYNPLFFAENTGEHLPLTILNIINKNTFAPIHPHLIVKHPKLDIAAVIVPQTNYSYLELAGATRYKKYDIGPFNLSDPPTYLKIPVFRNKYTKEKNSMYFCEDKGKRIKILQIEKERGLIYLQQNILGGWSGSPAIDPNNGKVIGIVSKGFIGTDGNGQIVYFNNKINKWIEDVKNKLPNCFSKITINNIPFILHNRSIVVKRKPISKQIEGITFLLN